MNWQTGFKRIRLVGTGAFALGVLLLLSVILTQSLGYAPNPPFVPLYAAFWPLGLMLLVLGALLWITVWVLSGFVETTPRTHGEPEPPRARFYS